MDQALLVIVAICLFVVYFDGYTSKTGESNNSKVGGVAYVIALVATFVGVIASQDRLFVVVLGGLMLPVVLTLAGWLIDTKLPSLARR